MTGHRTPAPSSTSVCPSGKLAHTTRRGAKEQALRLRQMYGQHLRPYLCEFCDLWHVGHLPFAVRQGLSSATEHYRAG